MEQERTNLFWAMFDQLEGEAPSSGHVELSRLETFILNQSFGIFDGRIQIEIFVKRMISSKMIVPALGAEGCYLRGTESACQGTEESSSEISGGV